ncbi:MAG: type II secretion system protein N [Brevundimonas sp.]|uniref:type II secretion system protein N n=1 Tax=Brevundimonas sp. TaxID=1871086 RepID=UPI0039188253
MFQLIHRLKAARLPTGAAFAVPGGARGLTESVLAGLLALPAAAVLWTFVTPAGPFGAPPPRAVGTPDISVLARTDGFFRTGAPSSLAEATAANSGSLRLFGVRSGGSGSGSAIIGLSDGRQVSVAAGEEIEPGLRLESVASDHVVVTRGASRTRLAFSEAPAGAASPPPPPSGQQIIAPNQAAAAGSGDPMSLLTSGALTPHVVDERITGFVVTPAGAGPAARAGLLPGDVLQAVNGQALDSVSSLPRIAAGLAGAESLHIRYERGGEVRAATFRIAQ